MYIPIWLIVLGLIIAYWLYKSQNKSGVIEEADTVEGIENTVELVKKHIFQLEHFDSPHFIDLQNDFDIMEANYLRLKQRYANTQDKQFDTAKDWLRYTVALRELKDATVLLDVDYSDNAFENLQESTKEPIIIKDEVEKKFKNLLDKDWLKLRPDYFERGKKVKTDVKKQMEGLKFGDTWKAYYFGETNFERMEKLRKSKEEIPKQL